jgi:hypothetical protein
MYWWITESGLTMDTIRTGALHEDFDQVAGKLLFQARQEFPNERCLPREKYLEIATLLDDLKRFTPREVLSEQFGKKLAEWNQSKGKEAITSFGKALTAKQPKWLHRQIMKRLYRAQLNFKRQSLLSNAGFS